MHQSGAPPTTPKDLFRHVLGDSSGYLATFTGQQASLLGRTARRNELTAIRQMFWAYPGEAREASEYLTAEANRERDTYFGVHLYRDRGSRLSKNASAAAQCLWLDEDEGAFPASGPEPTAIVRSSSGRRHLYWQLAQPVAIEWVVDLNKRIAVWAGGDAGKAGAASILRAPGTFNFKRHPRVDPVVGETTGIRPWEPVIMEQAIPPLPEPAHTPTPREEYEGPPIFLDDLLEEGDVEVLYGAPDSAGTKYAIVCPWLHDHSGNDRTGSYVGQLQGGGLWFYCHHAHCQTRTWRDFRLAIGWRIRKSRSRARRVWVAQ